MGPGLRKHSLFAGSNAGGERAAALYSLIGTAKLDGLDPEGYFREVVARIAGHPIHRVGELLPWNAVMLKAPRTEAVKPEIQGLAQSGGVHVGSMHQTC